MADPIFNNITLNPFGLSNVGRDASPALVDIDGDGDLDAFVGELYGNTLFFRNTGTANNPIFAAAITNPFGLSNVGYLASSSFVDIDNDSDLDAFVGTSEGNALFFKNTGTASNPIFAEPISNPFGLSSVNAFANPTFIDIDGDSDLDAFIGNYDGDTLFFRNTGTTEDPIFGVPETNPFGLSGVGRYMASPTFIDIDGDGDLDAFIGSGGNYSNPDGTWFFRNIGTVNNPVFYRDSENPFGLSRVGGYINPPVFADIDGDSDLDAFIGSGAGDISFFQNIGEGNVPFFSASSLGVGEVGLNPEPAFADIDGDGDLDAFIGKSDSYYDEEGGNTLFFENTGTVNSPAFAAPETNPFGLSDVGSFASPALVDIDSDGDLDVFIGNDAGNALFFENTGTVNSPAFAAPETNPFGLSDTGEYATPVFVDIDNDGDLDAFVGNAAGDAFFFQNTGTASSPAFAAPETNPFGLKGNPAFIDVDGDGDLDAFVEDALFRNTGTATSPAFTLESSSFGLPENFFRSFISSRTFIDIDGDGDLDAYVTGSYEYAGSYPFENFFINNNAPNVANLTTDETYTKGTSLNLTDIIISDPDSAIVTATLTLSDSAAGSLSTATSGTVTSTYDPGTGVWTANGALADVNTLLADLAFIPAAGFNDAFTINTSISDGVAEPLLGSKSFNPALVSTSGNDILTGTSSSNDTVTYAFATASVTVSLNITTQQDTGGAGLDTLTDIENLIGSDFDDDLTGNAANNILNGGAGNDILRGWSGADTLSGGSGNDSYFVENAGDVVIENFSEDIDQVSSRVTYSLPANIEELTLTGTAAVNGTGNSQNNVITGNNAANQLKGEAGNDILNGGAGSDILDGGIGTNTLTGGSGNDFFRFTSADCLDTITDFTVIGDTIHLENAVFTALTETGILASENFRIGAQALDADDFIIYNSETGILLYDVDGNGTEAAVQIAIVSAGLNMTHEDVVVI
ncbi:FG-GAP-like repeat-containing protein [Nitrosomonas sp. Nm166]|uniref:FG-GAP-like repeat-containing protein n=1 Tax=Nitrosomonas sp. Nm166 TaxID=1881054 RepID=UPI0008E01D1F|nr:FG-GAP-like repeat-containing protein [Nitrosomonas sp. Nm166]SFE67801.1 Ca2+-binding protein, RTX toxin-related [Nitrosomonas sp. Nm166]